MRYRKLDPQGDYVFGQQGDDFLKDSPEAVAQAVGTRLRETTGDWFLDKTVGTDWYGKVLGTATEPTRNLEVQRRILETPGVTQIAEYAAARDPDTRDFTVVSTVDTIYGEQATVQETMK